MSKSNLEQPWFGSLCPSAVSSIQARVSHSTLVHDTAGITTFQNWLPHKRAPRRKLSTMCIPKWNYPAANMIQAKVKHSTLINLALKVPKVTQTRKLCSIPKWTHPIHLPIWTRKGLYLFSMTSEYLQYQRKLCAYQRLNAWEHQMIKRSNAMGKLHTYISENILRYLITQMKATM